jgi:hypothetical protein
VGAGEGFPGGNKMGYAVDLVYVQGAEIENVHGWPTFLKMDIFLYLWGQYTIYFSFSQ